VTARAALLFLVRQIETVSAEIAALDTALRKENKASELGPRLETIPSIGPVIASALRARVTDAALFKNGRQLSAWIGIVPENDSSGGKVRQNGLSKKGDRYLRSLLVAGAMAVVQQAQIRPDKNPWVAKLLCRMSAKQAAIAIAQQDRADRLGHHGPRRRLRGWPSRPPISSGGVRGCRIRLGDGVIAAAAAHHCNARARGTRRKASRVAEVLMA
jgi:Transposase IS116/IS110/IS902 family